MDVLLEFPVKYIHRPNTSKIMGVADGLSRLLDALRSESPTVRRRTDLGEMVIEPREAV